MAIRALQGSARRHHRHVERHGDPASIAMPCWDVLLPHGLPPGVALALPCGLWLALDDRWWFLGRDLVRWCFLDDDGDWFGLGRGENLVEQLGLDRVFFA